VWRALPGQHLNVLLEAARLEADVVVAP